MYQRKNTNGHNSNSTINTNNMYSRTSSGGYGRDVEGGRGGGRFNDTNSNILEQQNNDRINELSDQVARLKVLAPRACSKKNNFCSKHLSLFSPLIFCSSPSSKLGSND
jgi:hypothetical protein